MSGLGTSQTQQSQSSQTQPWAPAQPMLQNLLGGLSQQFGNYQPTQNENSALNQITANAQNMPNYGAQANAMAGSYLGGDPTGLLSPALKQYQSQLNPYANGSNLDPTKAPGMDAVLSTIRNDVGNSVNQQFAGAGRDLSGMNQQSLARGISQGEAVPLLGQYNQNVQNQLSSAGNLYNASGTTAGALTGNQMQGLNLASMAPSLTNAGPMAILQAEAARRGLPLNNLGMLENLTIPIAGLGTQSQGQSQGSYTMSPLQIMLGGSGIFKNLFG